MKHLIPLLFFFYQPSNPSPVCFGVSGHALVPIACPAQVPGPSGPQGLTGPQGPQGPQGVPGVAGTSNLVGVSAASVGSGVAIPLKDGTFVQLVVIQNGLVASNLALPLVAMSGK